MKREKWLVLCIVLWVVQLVACEKGKLNEDAPAPIAARANADSVGKDSIGKDSIVKDSIGKDTIIIDSTWTNDSTGTDSSHYDPSKGKSMLADDIVRITPIVEPDSSANWLLFQCATDKKYPCGYNILVTHLTAAENAYLIDFDNIIQGFNCSPGSESQGLGTAVITDMPAKFSGGLEIRLNQKVYKGFIKRTGVSTYEFTWPDESRVVITKKSL
ncbi:hypothetical protein LZD49_23625 [Dyadobacter sp. CY261]|uniref:hypothetical protein n=1 Tax=Dyadobacter sp. CY261 TaxID=2907203 RepID=UPI001F4774C8|nr:hypothetical protein [Dyadobacter sp. CY261]MCF0073489.1 hypothetical protein [Dyadobacter sp. CY261]